MDVGRIQLILFVSLVFATGTDALSGHTKTFWNVTTEDVLQCVDWDIMCDVTKQNLACCRHDVVPVQHPEEITTCAEGWLEDNNDTCSIAACTHCPSRTFCLSNGTCANYCEVSSSHTGSCICSPGFRSPTTCTYLDNTVKRKMSPIVFLEKINRSNNQTVSKTRLYKERPWSNRNGFNHITIIVPAVYFPEVISSLRKVYKEDDGTSAFVSFSKYESSLKNDSQRSLPTECVGNNTTHTDICTLSAFDRFIDHGDTLNIAFHSSFIYSSPPNPVNRTQTVYSSKVIGFDFQPPVHCTENNCSNQPLDVSPEISQGRIQIKWNGWEDRLSGIEHYILNVYKMTPDKAGHLHQPNDPCFSLTTEQTSTDYLPSQPGVYAFFLIVKDKASNRNYARRFTLYDNTSRININNTNKLYFSSASAESHYHWQSSNTFISVCWKDHFVNNVHDKGHFLSQIVAEPVLVDNSTVIPTYDDHEGKVKLTGTPNARGIIRFEYVGPIAAAPSAPKPGTESYIPLGQVTNASLQREFITARGDGPPVKVWIQAYDVMGHTAVDSTYLYFDSSPPTAHGDKAVLQKNIDPAKFTSRVTMEATDKDSGIYQIQWDVQDTVTGRILTSGFTPGNKTNDESECESNINECSCVADDVCYLYQHYLSIHHCPIKLSNTDLQMADLVLNVRVVNYALLSYNFTMQMGKATTLSGIKQYSQPIGIHTPTLTTDSVRLAWNFENNCYTRTGLSVAFKRTGQESGTLHDLGWNETDFEMMGLLPDTEYVATFVIHYGNESSSSLDYIFTTESVKPGTTYIAAIVVVSLVATASLLGLVVTLIKSRISSNNSEPLLPSRLPSQKDKVHRKLNGSDRYKKTSQKNSSKLEDDGNRGSAVQYVSEAYEDTMTGNDDDEFVYEDLNDVADTPPSDDATDASFDELISEGSFANVYVGTCHLPMKGRTQCALKTHNVGVDEGQIQEYEEEAIALLQFHRRHAIQALNIIQYYGFINEGKEQPTLVMEYCGNGALSDWLADERNQAQIVDLKEIVYGIASGMEYLVARKIFHGNLTSFNILLTSELVPKIKGIGERKHSAESLRWQAPETFDHKENPNEAADAWSYGVVMWEVYSQGKQPYGDIEDTRLEAVVKSGLNLGQPDLCSDAFNAVIVTCLQIDPASRPTFTDIVDAIKTTKGSSENNEIEESGIYENTDNTDMRM